MAVSTTTQYPDKLDTHSDEIELTSNMAADASIVEPQQEAYSISWRTFGGFIALSLAWATSTFSITGPNFAIGYVAAEYPEAAANASWIANGPLICYLTLAAIIGASSDRYGKKWFIIGGGFVGMIGAIISGVATSLNMVIVGQTFTGIGGAALIVTVAAGMEIVPAKLRTAIVSGMAVINGTCGAIASYLVFATCMEHGLGWRWGYRILAIYYVFAVILVFVLYNPPPTRLRQQGTFVELLKSIDFIGIGLLAVGSVLLTAPLVWCVSAFAWNSAQIIPFLIGGPLILIAGLLILIAFGIYEWKGRSDGILHHDFFRSRSFVVFMVYGFVDGSFLYGLSLFIPNQLKGVYYTQPMLTARALTSFNGGLLAGFLIFGFIATKTKQFRWPLVMSSVLLTLFCGLTFRSDSSNLGYFEAMTGICGLLTAATETIPVAGIGLVVPNHLIGTSNMVLGTFRALGGAIGIAIFSSVYNNKAANLIPKFVAPVLAQAKIPKEMFPTIFKILSQAPATIAKVPGLTADTIHDVLAATAVGAAHSYADVWLCLMALAAVCLVLSFFVVDEPDKMNDHVESVLEKRPAVDENKDLPV